MDETMNDRPAHKGYPDVPVATSVMRPQHVYECGCRWNEHYDSCPNHGAGYVFTQPVRQEAA